MRVSILADGNEAGASLAAAHAACRCGKPETIDRIKKVIAEQPPPGRAAS